MEFKEMKEQVDNWLSELRMSRTAPGTFRYEDLESDPGDGSVAGRIIFCTATNQYSIRFTNRHELGYLGCGATSRLTRPGETWTRGSDLADGEFSPETWDRIVRDIVAYELVELAPVTESPAVREDPVPA